MKFTPRYPDLLEYLDLSDGTTPYELADTVTIDAGGIELGISGAVVAALLPEGSETAIAHSLLEGTNWEKPEGYSLTEEMPDGSEVEIRNGNDWLAAGLPQEAYEWLAYTALSALAIMRERDVQAARKELV